MGPCGEELERLEAMGSHFQKVMAGKPLIMVEVRRDRVAPCRHDNLILTRN